MRLDVHCALVTAVDFHQYSSTTDGSDVPTFVCSKSSLEPRGALP